MNRGIIHKLIAMARKYLKKVNITGKKLVKSLDMIPMKGK